MTYWSKLWKPGPWTTIKGRMFVVIISVITWCATFLTCTTSPQTHRWHPEQASWLIFQLSLDYLGPLWESSIDVFHKVKCLCVIQWCGLLKHTYISSQSVSLKKPLVVYLVVGPHSGSLRWWTSLSWLTCVLQHWQRVMQGSSLVWKWF